MASPRDADTRSAIDSAPAGVARSDASLPCLTIVEHPDASRVGERALLPRQTAGRPLRLSRNELVIGRAPLDDPFLSRAAIEIRTTRAGGLSLEVPERVGAKLDGAPLAGPLELDVAALDRGASLELAKRVTLWLHRASLAADRTDHGLDGRSAAVGAVRRAIERVADLDVPVLILGETGVGKERVAQAIHRASGRGGPCVAVNVATLGASLAAAELFGHTRGAFTGAGEPQDGLFVAADGGTLFLDEIGELSAEVQPMLLRALETGQVRPVGGRAERSVDVRVLAATDADLSRAVERGAFRPALYHRLRGFELRVPPLRARREDIPGLAMALLREELGKTGELSRLEVGDPDAPLWLDRGLLLRLVRHDWPGNVRQLRGVVRQIAVASRGRPSLGADASVERELARLESAEASAETPIDDRPVGRDTLLEALEAHGWSFGRAAAALGITRNAIYRMAEGDEAIRTGAELSLGELTAALEAHGGDLDAMVGALRVSKRAIKLRLKALGLR